MCHSILVQFFSFFPITLHCCYVVFYNNPDLHLRLEEMFLGAISDKESTELCTAGLCGISELLNLYHMTGF